MAAASWRHLPGRFDDIGRVAIVVVDDHARLADGQSELAEPGRPVPVAALELDLPFHHVEEARSAERESAAGGRLPAEHASPRASPRPLPVRPAAPRVRGDGYARGLLGPRARAQDVLDHRRDALGVRGALDDGGLDAGAADALGDVAYEEIGDLVDPVAEEIALGHPPTRRWPRSPARARGGPRRRSARCRGRDPPW